MKEIEIRAIVSNKKDIVKNMEQEGFKKEKEIIQHDIMIDKENAELFKSGQKIRIRIEGNSATLTYKGDLNADKNISKREELNITIEKNKVDDYIKFLSALGYFICFQIKKEREVWLKNDIQITFDKWPIIGVMMEIEGEETNIIDVSKKVAPNIRFSNYRLKELFDSKIKETGKSIEELKMEYLKENNFDLGNIELILK